MAKYIGYVGENLDRKKMTYWLITQLDDLCTVSVLIKKRNFFIFSVAKINLEIVLN